jgi:3-oxoacyl-(acyl-carrier-protein) synthase
MAACRASDGLFAPGGYHVGDDPDAYDPFAAEGAVLGEGSAFFLLERLNAAKARGAEVRAVLSLDESDATALIISPANGGWAVPAPAGQACAPKGLYGDALGAAGALATAAGIAGLERAVVPPVRSGREALDDRREPAGADGAVTVLVEDLDTAGAKVSVCLRRVS